MKQKFTLSLVWCSEARDIRLETAPKSHFPDGIRLLSPVLNWTQYFIKEIEIEITLPEDFDPLKPQLDALEALEKSIKEKYQLDLTEIKDKRHQLLETKV